MKTGVPSKNTQCWGQSAWMMNTGFLTYLLQSVLPRLSPLCNPFLLSALLNQEYFYSRTLQYHALSLVAGNWKQLKQWVILGRYLKKKHTILLSQQKIQVNFKSSKKDTAMLTATLPNFQQNSQLMLSITTEMDVCVKRKQGLAQLCLDKKEPLRHGQCVPQSNLYH